MELAWEDLHCSGTVGFSRDLYEKYSLAPNVKELWTLAQSRSPVKVEVKSEPKVENDNNKPDCAPPLVLEKTTTHENARETFPEPRVPFPCFSRMTFKEQSSYMRWLTQKLLPSSFSESDDFSLLQEHVNIETSEFMKYLQDVAKICADDYNYMSQGAALYSEECLRASLEMVKNFPQVYLSHEITSITGGKFNPGLSLNFEKQLLALGNMKLVRLFKNLPKNVQLPEDCESVSSVTPPVKKASLTHTGISNDLNAAKLYARYEPHVCMTRQAFVRLLNNHGPEYSDQWEIPIWVKMTSGKDPRKEVYIDSPLVKTEMTVREKSQLFHEESLKLALKKTVQKNVQELQLNTPTSESQRSLISFNNDSDNFESDLADLETFGESASSNPSGSGVKPALAVVKGPAQVRPPARKKLKCELPAERPSDLSSSADSDEERLVIDAPPSPRSRSAVTDRPKPLSTPAKKEHAPLSDSVLDTPSSRSSEGVPDPLETTSPSPIPDTPRSPSPEQSRQAQSSSASPATKRTGRRAAPRASRDCDQLGQILQMQSALLKPIPDSAQDPVSSPPRGATKEANRGPVQGASACSASTATGPVNNQTTAQYKRLLSEELLVCAEDELNYESPEEGNVLYCLYSLQDVLMMVRSSVPMAVKKPYMTGLAPAHILPKLEYQLCYGMEYLTKSEVCQFWAEKQLHSNTFSYVGHIEALTSKLVMLEELTPKKMGNASCAFVPAKSLNILHNLLKKVVGFQEGRYLLCHKAGESLVTILKASEGPTVARATYDLHQAHSHLPQAPPNGPIPWVPVDPTHVRPFHRRYNRIPCTFPPKMAFQANRPKTKKGKGKAPGAQGPPGTPHGPANRKGKNATPKHRQQGAQMSGNDEP
ncbi:hypothetical protein SKAU_G00348800 [Synaphobranchus kaupii]|uniref:Little elongation complex subunit 2 C-terminal domain-containing protein n=1 Tax=Synaphobranchus kaupii TaxID=118154 RepID=A0A9Q1IHR2_SYNKA|nr:hypothetical protein SKAU_G00348800 [Synaphobranchus kaupii]